MTPAVLPAGSFKRQVGWLYLGLLGFNLLAWGWAWRSFAGYPSLAGLGLLAYTLGLRHAMDADHIAAIDNVTRKLLHEGRSPLAAGPWFALGHSTVVMVVAAVVALSSISLRGHFSMLQRWGHVVGTAVSTLFLLWLAIVNLRTFMQLRRRFVAVRQGDPSALNASEPGLSFSRGWLRAFQPCLGWVSHSWQLYPIGLLFGLGFDTASEVALFSLTATQAVHGLAWWALLALPLLFAAGMTLIDGSDGVLMAGVYRWAFEQPIRKIYYNLGITLLSVLAAVVIASLEALALLAEQWPDSHAGWHWLHAAMAHFGVWGYGLLALFVTSWLVSALIYRYKRVDSRPAPLVL